MNTTRKGIRPAWKSFLFMAALASGGSLSAQTCDAVDVPYAEDFNAVTTPALPECMTTETISGNTWRTVSAPGAMTGNSANVSYTDAGSPDMDTWLYTQGLNLTGGTSYRLTYVYYNNSTGYTERMSVSFGNDTVEAAMTNQLADHNEIMTNDLQSGQVDFTPAADGVYYIGFKCYSIADQNQLYLDDIAVTATPSCEAPSDLSANNISVDGADLIWVASSTNPTDGYQWEVRDAADAVVANGSTVAGDTTDAATGLSTNTPYDLYVRAVCGEGDTSLWAGPFHFATPCEAFDLPFTEGFNSGSNSQACWTVIDANDDGSAWDMDYDSNPYEGDEAAAINTDFNAGNNDDWLISPAINLTGADRLRFWQRVQSADEPNDFEVLLSTTGTAPEDFTETLLPFAEYSNTDYMEHVISLAGQTGAVHIAWHVPAGGADGWRLYIDKVIVEAIPSCEAPTGLAASNLTTTGADVSWTTSTSNPAEGYQWEVRDAADAVVANGSTAAGDTTDTASGLDADTGYVLYVRSVCGAGDTSVWADPFAFTTPCLATDVPYSEDFDDETELLPNCMSIETISGNPWTLEDAPTGMTGNVANVSYTSSGSPDMDSWLFTQGLNLTAGTTYRLTYDYFNDATLWTERMAVAYGNTPDGAAMTNPLADHNAINTTTVQDNEVFFTPTADGVYYIGFKCYSIADQNQLYLDNISVIVFDQCNALPTPGATTGIDSICPGTEFTLGIENTSIEGGISYQWEVSTDGTTWTNATGADSLATYTTSQSAETWYRVQVTCESNGTAASTPLQVTMNTPSECTCIPTGAGNNTDEMLNFTLAGLNNTSGPSEGTNGYMDYTPTVAAAQLVVGDSYTASLTSGPGSGSHGAAIWIDYNDNGVFEATEMVASIGLTIQPSTTVSFPAFTAANDTGIHRLRVQYRFNKNGAELDPCVASLYSETEDYLVEVTAASGVEDCLGVVGGPALPGTACIASSGFGGTWSDACVCEENVGIEEIVAKQGMAVYPNPASTELFITTADGKPARVNVYDMVGHLVLAESNTNRLDISSLAPGSYTVSIVDATGTPQAHARFMKQ